MYINQMKFKHIFYLTIFMLFTQCTREVSPTGPEIKSHIHIPQGQWVAVSFPAQNIARNVLFPDSSTSIYCWNPESTTLALDHYQINPDTIKVGTGYWIKSDSVPLTISLESLIEFNEDSLELFLSAGQNFIGNPYPYTVNLPDTSLTYIYQEYLNDSIILKDTVQHIEPWKAYWVQCTQSMKIVFKH